MGVVPTTSHHSRAPFSSPLPLEHKALPQHPSTPHASQLFLHSPGLWAIPCRLKFKSTAPRSSSSVLTKPCVSLQMSAGRLSHRFIPSLTQVTIQSFTVMPSFLIPSLHSGCYTKRKEWVLSHCEIAHPPNQPARHPTRAGCRSQPCVGFFHLWHRRSSPAWRRPGCPVSTVDLVSVSHICPMCHRPESFQLLPHSRADNT